ncbi:MAG: DUF3667 domain-containing protein [Pseudomonadota bacterium]
MSDLAEGLGIAVEGSLASKAVEPTAGDAAGKPTATIECANCGTMFSGKFCPNCGQKAHIHRTLTAIAHDLIHGVLHLDGKLSHTLPLLIFKPGRLTRRYIEGERAKFVSPMSMFLFGVFAMFAVFQMVGLTTPTDLDFGAPTGVIRAEGEAEIKRMEDQLATMAPDDPELESRQKQLELLRGLVTGTSGQTGAQEEREAGDQPTFGETLEFGWEETTPDERLTGIPFIDQTIKKWQKNPGLMLYKMQANGYKFSWLLIPLSLPFVWLIFLWRRSFKAYDHVVFITYSLSFMSLLFITASLIAPLSAGGWAFALVALGAPLHLYKHLRYTYGLSRFSTIWRFGFLMFSMLLILLLFGNTLLVLGGF